MYKKTLKQVKQVNKQKVQKHFAIIEKFQEKYFKGVPTLTI